MLLKAVVFIIFCEWKCAIFTSLSVRPTPRSEMRAPGDSCHARATTDMSSAKYLTSLSDFGCTALGTLSITCMMSFKIQLTVVNLFSETVFAWVRSRRWTQMGTLGVSKFLITQPVTGFTVDIKVRQEHLKPRTPASPWCHFIMIQLAAWSLLYNWSLDAGRICANQLYLLLAWCLFESDVDVGRLYNFIWMSMHRLELTKWKKIVRLSKLS